MFQLFHEIHSIRLAGVKLPSAPYQHGHSTGLIYAVVSYSLAILIYLLISTEYAVAAKYSYIADDQYATQQDSEIIQGLSTKPVRKSIHDFLIEFNLDDLMITQLEEQLRIALGANRIPYAKQLAIQYGHMFDAAVTDDERAYWEQKSIDLKESVPDVNTTALRLNIAKASYVRAEYVAEQYRLRAIDYATAQEARRSMLSLAAQFKEEFRTLRSKSQKLEDIQFSSDDAEGIRKAGSRLQELDAQIAQTAYYAAWSLYYESWLSTNPNPETADEALKYFGWILMGRFDTPHIEETPIELISYEHIARSILGVALVHSVSGSFATALDWLDLLSEGSLPHKITAQTPAYHLDILFQREIQHILSDNGPRWDDIFQLLNTLEEKQQLTPTVARLAAVLALDASTRTGGVPEARELANKAITILAEMNQLSQVLELSQYFNLDVLGTNSFHVAYVLALQAHERARSLHDNDMPTNDENITRAYREAEKQLIATIRRSDAHQHESSVRQAKMLAAWSRYFVSDFATAAIRFGDAAVLFDAAKAEHALWMRIVCLDRLLSQNVDVPDSDTATRDYGKQLQTTMELFIENYPSSKHTGQIKYRLVANKDYANQDQIAQLLSIPRKSSAYDQSQGLAERKLYRMFIGSTGMSHINIGHQYLDIARPLLRQDALAVFAGNANNDHILTYLSRARRIVHVLLTRGIAEVREARRILDRLSTGASAGLLDLADIATELEYRNFQVHVLEGDFETASMLCEQLWISNDAGNLAQAACREMLSYTVQDWRAFPDHPNIESKLLEILEIGKKLNAFPPDDYDLNSATESLPDTDTTDVHWVYDEQLLLIFAEAGHGYLKRNPDNASLRNTIERCYQLLLRDNPLLYRLLKASASLAEYRGETEIAIEHFRTSMTILSLDQTEWFEAKYHLVRLISINDIPHAHEVMKQHVLLHPEYGPLPWDKRLEELASSIRSSFDSSETGDDQ